MLNTQISHNDSTPANILLSDKRQQNYDQDTLWDKLNLSQQYAVCSLGQFGYLLTYVREVGNKTLAILKQGDKVATINASGNINVTPVTLCRS